MHRTNHLKRERTLFLSMYLAFPSPCQEPILSVHTVSSRSTSFSSSTNIDKQTLAYIYWKSILIWFPSDMFSIQNLTHHCIYIGEWETRNWMNYPIQFHGESDDINVDADVMLMFQFHPANIFQIDNKNWHGKAVAWNEHVDWIKLSMAVCICEGRRGCCLGNGEGVGGGGYIYYIRLWDVIMARWHIKFNLMEKNGWRNVTDHLPGGDCGRWRALHRF